MAVSGRRTHGWRRHHTRRIALTTIVAAALASIAAIPALFASRVTERDLAEVLSASAGTTVTWRGQPEVTVFPRLQITVADVTVVDGRDGGAAFASIPRLQVSFKTLPLLWGRIETAALSLIEPRIRVAGDPTNAAAWEGDASSLGALISAHAGARPSVIAVSDGVISYRNDETGRLETIQAVDLRLAWNPASRIAAIAGRLVSDGRAVDVDAELDEPWKIFSSSGSEVRLMLASSADRTLWVDGNFRLVREDPQSPVSSLLIADATFQTGNASARGTLTLARSGARPRLTGALEFEELYLSNYLNAWLPDTLAEFLALPLHDRWLALADLDLDLAASEVDLGGVRVEEALLRLAVEKGQLHLEVEQGRVAGGDVQGSLQVSPAGFGLAARAAGRIEGVSLARAGANLRRGRTTTLIGAEQGPQGTAATTFDLAARGPTVRAMVDSLSGWVEAEVQDGSIDGADTIATLERLVESDSAIAEGEAPFIPIAGRTYFSSLTARLTATEGLARVEGLSLTGERFEISLSGELDLTGGEVTAQGTARLLDEAGSEGSVLIELPFGVGGTLLEPMSAPGIPRRYHYLDDQPVQHVRRPLPVADETPGRGDRHVG